MTLVSMMTDLNIQIPVTWRLEWDDGFGARGWKLDDSLNDPYVIAATADTGSRIPTSVPVHDILDHHLCGLPLSGHRNEAIALVQLGLRTGSSPAPDFAAMVEEDLLQGRVNGESMRRFLPNDLQVMLPSDEADNSRIINFLSRQLGEQALRDRLIAWFFELGEAGMEKVITQWKAHGLDYHRRGAMGLALQQVLTLAEGEVIELALKEAQGRFLLNNRCCALHLTLPIQRRFQAAV